MYSTCIFCHAPLGTNDAIEHFPVGRRLAFDPAKGRLWVVCARCLGWNLTPLEERWEAIEECERRFRDTRLRVSTDNIGLARLREGVELVRVGPALRPELAVWRYGARFARRRRELSGAGALIAAGTIVVAGSVASLGVPAIAPFVIALGPITASLLLGRMRSTDQREARRFIDRVLGNGLGGSAFHDLSQQSGLLLRATPGGGWGLRIQSEISSIHADFEGADALRTAAIILPAVNVAGGGRRVIARAVSDLEEVGDARAYFPRALERSRKLGLLYSPINWYPAEMRFALEMAAHEEAERRSMEGELALLEQAWREAESIAAIADDLTLPAAVTDRMMRLKGQNRVKP